MAGRSADPTAGSSVLGGRRPRVDADEKVRGATRFAADISEPDLLHGRLVLSQHAHARIVSVDTTAALAVPGVTAALLARDLPVHGGGTARHHEPLARDEVLFAGQPVCIVLADSEAAAEAGVAAVVVDYAPLPAVLDLETGMRLGGPRARPQPASDENQSLGAAHTATGGGGGEADDEELSDNVVSRLRYRDGDLPAALERSDVVVEARFTTPWIYQAYLEPQAATARPEPDGRLTVTTATQGTFHTRAQLAKALGLSKERIRVVPTPLGGSFGAKLMLVEPLAAAAALALGRAVRIAMTRSEDIAAGNPSPGGLVDLRVGATRDGTLTALEARVVFERGAYHEWGIESIVALLLGGVYRWQAHDVRAYGVETNRAGFGAYRAPGAPQAAFALESVLDELAKRLDLDPIDLRIRNAAGDGDPRVDGKTWPRLGTRECLERVRQHELWRRRDELPPYEGVGVAIGVWPGASGQAGAVCRFDEDGGLTIVTGSVDMSGTRSGFAVIAAEVFGVAPERVRVVAGDSDSAPRSPLSGGSQVTYSVGRAVERAAEAARQKLLTVAAAELETDPADLEIADGEVRARGAPSRSIPLERLGERALSGRYEPVEAAAGAASTDLAPSVAAHLVHLGLDPETGEVRLYRWVVAQDVGRALDLALCEGQMHGGVAQGIGWALYEELAVDESGQLLTASLADYPVPGAPEVPDIETLVVEVPAPNGPLGAKGIGEAPVVACAAAVANALAAASGLRLYELPMTASRVWNALTDRNDTADAIR